MKQLLDQNKNPIENAYRGDHGSIVIKDEDAYHRYKKEKERVDDLNNMKFKFQEIESKLDHLEKSIESFYKESSKITKLMMKILEKNDK